MPSLAPTPLSALAPAIAVIFVAGCSAATTSEFCDGGECGPEAVAVDVGEDASVVRDTSVGDTTTDAGEDGRIDVDTAPEPDVVADVEGPDAEPCGSPELCNGLDDDCDGAVDEGSRPACRDACCDDRQVCLPIGCVPDLGTCDDNDDCWSDSYCVDGLCLPYGWLDGTDRDDSCERDVVIDALVPSIQCAWTETHDGVDTASVHVMSTPVVVDFDFDADPLTIEPSIVFTTFPTEGNYGAPGTLRVIDGATCATQFSLEDVSMSPAPVALGDIDLDGRAEVVTAVPGGGLAAYRYDPAAAAFSQLWRSATCSGDARSPDTTGGRNRWSGPSLYDLDDDGIPEVIYGGVVYDAAGCLRSTAFSFASYSVSVISVVADVDEDGVPEIVFGDGVYQWDPASGQLAAESWFPAAGLSAGQVAVADMGNFPVAALGGADGAEIVVVSSGVGRVQTLDGEVVFSASIPGGGTGGPPTVADFDGDGRAEFATAGGERYVVFDLDCVAGGDPAGCGGAARTDGVLWQQPSQDRSSNVTGSSVFDFNADGAAEAVYADECYLRIYEGATGRVVYSATRSSGTTYENPVIADVDGDFHTEIVSSVNDYGTIGCADPDPLFPESRYARSHGVVVLRDEADQWAASRPVWNQHAYSVTHVRDDGTIPRSSEVAPNWRVDGLNNFRQNVQGTLSALGVPDLTAAEGGDPREVECERDGFGLLEARICNRGLLPLGRGMVVAFADGGVAGPELCRAVHDSALPIGECAEVSCRAELASRVVDVYVVIDPDDEVEECWEGNNFAFFGEVRCKS